MYIDEVCNCIFGCFQRGFRNGPPCGIVDYCENPMIPLCCHGENFNEFNPPALKMVQCASSQGAVHIRVLDSLVAIAQSRNLGRIAQMLGYLELLLATKLVSMGFIIPQYHIRCACAG